jgi:hypothetical protein
MIWSLPLLAGRCAIVVPNTAVATRSNHPTVLAAIGRHPRPVVTGIGHVTNTTAADRAAYLSCITPTAATQTTQPTPSSSRSSATTSPRPTPTLSDSSSEQRRSVVAGRVPADGERDHGYGGDDRKTGNVGDDFDGHRHNNRDRADDEAELSRRPAPGPRAAKHRPARISGDRMRMARNQRRFHL